VSSLDRLTKRTMGTQQQMEMPQLLSEIQPGSNNKGNEDECSATTTFEIRIQSDT
jgi:hypothetical protein